MKFWQKHLLRLAFLWNKRKSNQQTQNPKNFSKSMFELIHAGNILYFKEVWLSY